MTTQAADDRLRRIEQRLTKLEGRITWAEGAYKRLIRKPKPSGKPNAQDLTLRNLRKTRTDIAKLVTRVAKLEAGK
ncbi:MAG TPA: hypothetical protein DCQ04_13280 [Actinobacteria bacterium]|nr:hypothetical protein [Actinomycetota bacterium]